MNVGKKEENLIDEGNKRVKVRRGTKKRKGVSE